MKYNHFYYIAKRSPLEGDLYQLTGWYHQLDHAILALKKDSNILKSTSDGVVYIVEVWGRDFEHRSILSKVIRKQ